MLVAPAFAMRVSGFGHVGMTISRPLLAVARVRRDHREGFSSWPDFLRRRNQAKRHALTERLGCQCL